MAMAWSLPDEIVDRLQEEFLQLASPATGTITQLRLRYLLDRAGTHAADIDSLCQRLQAAGIGDVSYGSYLAASAPRTSREDEAALKLVLRRFDSCTLASEDMRREVGSKGQPVTLEEFRTWLDRSRHGSPDLAALGKKISSDPCFSQNIREEADVGAGPDACAREFEA
jgi:hypothetical protein